MHLVLAVGAPMVCRDILLGEWCTGSGPGVTMHSTHQLMKQRNNCGACANWQREALVIAMAHTQHTEEGAGVEAGTATQHFNGAVDSKHPT